MNISFLHKSFIEHLLAEYYIDSVTLPYEIGKYYLNIGMPSEETLGHLQGLLSFIENTSGSFKKQIETFADSLHRSQSDLKQVIIDNAKRIFEAEEIILQKDKLDRDGNGIWLSLTVPPYKYSHLWIHRWLSLYILK